MRPRDRQRALDRVDLDAAGERVRLRLPELSSENAGALVIAYAGDGACRDPGIAANSAAIAWSVAP